MARRKVVFVIVEGPSDEAALGVGLSHVFDRDSVYVHIMRGDITTRNGVCPENIVARIGNEVKAYAKAWHYTQKDFQQIIHIIDTDGAYISDDKVLEDLACKQPAYCDEGIRTADVSGIIARNKRKRENLFRIRTCGEIWKIKYRVFYMSCNLDHVLYDKRNSTDEEKEADAYRFAKTYRNDTAGFVEFLCESPFSVRGDYKESWKYIEKGLNSLHRGTNLPICLLGEH